MIDMETIQKSSQHTSLIQKRLRMISKQGVKIPDEIIRIRKMAEN